MAVKGERQKVALNAIKQAFGTQAGEDSVNLFVRHHLEELRSSYWQQHLGSRAPEPAAILGLLELSSSWGDGDIEYFDFTLPDEATDYVVSVHFDGAGTIDGISMES
jgi:Protein of unknown function (DUF2004)